MTRQGEFDLIAKLFAPLANSPGALGLRDDAAVIKVSPGCDLVLTTDTVIAGIHFLQDDPPDLVARKALRVNLSDLAAKGAQPVGVLQALTLGEGIDDIYLERYARGLAEDLTTFSVPLLGGDTTSHRLGPLTVTITALGEVINGGALLRSGARNGDLLCVSGDIGDAAIGLLAATGKLPSLSRVHHDYLVGRYRLPEPRLKLGLALRGIATACLDISDGLCADVAHLCAASGVSADITWDKVPLSAAVDAGLRADQSLRARVLGGGDDYELAFTVPPARLGELEARASAVGTPVTVIGHILESSDATTHHVTVRAADGTIIPVPSPGYRHG